MNPKGHDGPVIRNSIIELGYIEPIVLDERTGLVISGHGRREQLIEAEADWVDGDAPPDGIMLDAIGRWLVPVSRGWASSDEEHAKAALIVLNRAVELGGYRPDALALLLEDLASLSVPSQPDMSFLELAGYTPDDLDGLLASLVPKEESSSSSTSDEAAFIDAPQRVSEGEIWDIGPHRLICGDCTDAAVIARVLDGGTAALAFTSPPYSDARAYDGPDLSPEHLAKFLPALVEHTRLTAMNLGLIRRDHAIVRYWDTYIAAAEACGMRLLSWNIWDRGTPQSMAQQTAMFPIEHEFVFVFGAERVRVNRVVLNKTGGNVQGSGNRQPDGTVTRRENIKIKQSRPLGSVVRIPSASGLTETGGVGHPAMFPVAFPASYIEALTRKGELVLDPFAGAGTTLLAADQLGRVGIGVEISPRYCDMILERFLKKAPGLHVCRR